MVKTKGIIQAKGVNIQVYTDGFRNDYISLTDIAKYKSDEPKDVIKNWLRSKDTIEFLGRYGLIAYLCLFAIGMYFALKIERYKKKYNIQSYKEIVAFMEGKDLNEIEKQEKKGKDHIKK